ncbi:peptidoglycan recognition protein 3-like [Carettochelys insculpta]|uniref:peptidoglycan recognition protein 3-like n=1 Tax=Carettochelys insculpta TaxID=44489 RepID=UPI003EBFAB49
MQLTWVVGLLALCAVTLGCPAIVLRSQWGGRPPRSRAQLKTPAPYLIIHHTAGNRCTTPASCRRQVMAVQTLHMVTWGWSDIGYNFLIGEDGRVYGGRGWTTIGAHAKNWNDKSLGISFLGTFTETAPNAAALNAARRLIQCAASRGFLSYNYTLKGHRDVSPTDCPGDALYKVITQWPRFKDAAAACVALSALACGCPTIVTRAQWQARSPTGRTSLSTPVPYVIIHHTAGSSCTSQASCSQVVRGIQNYHMDSQGWSDISYNFLIGEDGRVYEGRGWTTRGAHATNWNSKSLGISFLGTFTNRVPNAAALNAATSLIQCAVSRGALSNSYTLKGHCNVGQTSCPGDALYKVITQWPNFKA